MGGGGGTGERMGGGVRGERTGGGFSGRRSSVCSCKGV